MRANMNSMLSVEIKKQSHDTACQQGNTVAQAYLVNKISRSNTLTHTESNTYYEREFGFIPVQMPNITLPVFEGRTLEAESMQDWVVQAHKFVKKEGLPNYLGARIKVPSQLNLRNWRRFLHDYNLKIICEYLEFGFPLNINEELFTYNIEITNHASARLQLTGVDKYFNVEVKKMAMVGPFTEKPFSKIHYSPLMTRPKPGGEVL